MPHRNKSFAHKVRSYRLGHVKHPPHLDRRDVVRVLAADALPAEWSTVPHWCEWQTLPDAA